MDAGDYVTVTNATQVHLSGKKGQDKVYRHYSGFMGGLKEVPIGRLRERKGEDVSGRVSVWTSVRLLISVRSLLRLTSTSRSLPPWHITPPYTFPVTLPKLTDHPPHHTPQIIKKAVSGMLPKNTFRDRRLARLKITTGEVNPWDGNVMKVYSGLGRNVGESGEVVEKTV